MFPKNPPTGQFAATAETRELLLSEKAALVLIDLQEGFAPPFWEYWAGPGGRRNHPDAEEVAARLLRTWREGGRPVFHVRHDSVNPDSPLRPGRPGNPLSALVRPSESERVYVKHVNSAFIGTELEADLRAAGIDTLVMAGIQTDHCLSTSARMAANLGFRTVVVSDASATFDRTGPDGKRYAADLMHATALTSLHGEFATIASSAEVLEAIR